MKVKELIELLITFNEDADVYYENQAGVFPLKYAAFHNESVSETNDGKRVYISAYY